MDDSGSNSLLDFVMSLVRDPAAAAGYAADPAQAIADAHLEGVTSVDVDNLVPVVSESLSTSGATQGADNIWASGAATSAFDAFDVLDAFDVPAPDPLVTDNASVVDDGLHEAEQPAPAVSGLDFTDAPVIDVPVEDASEGLPTELVSDFADWQDAVADGGPIDDSVDFFS